MDYPAPEMLETLFEAMGNLEDEGAIADDLAEGVGHGTHALAVVRDGEIALHERKELSIKVEAVDLMVPEELALDADRDRADFYAMAIVDNLHGLQSDGLEEPGDHHTIHVDPKGYSVVDGIFEDVIGEGVAPKGEDHVAVLFVVLGGEGIQ